MRLCTLELKAAAAFVQQAHVRKHEAELYPELKFHLKKRGIKKTADQWGDGIYSQLFDIREFLEAHAGEWDSLSPNGRLVLLREVFKAPVKEELVPGALGETVADTGSPGVRILKMIRCQFVRLFSKLG